MKTCRMIALAALLVLAAGCTKRAEPPAPAKPAAVIMEKVLADQPDRPRTTLKVIIPNPPDRAAVSAALSSTLESLRADDPSLKAVIIWAYASRDELNAPNFTLGKLEWSADGKDFMGQKPLDPNPRIDAIRP